MAEDCDIGFVFIDGNDIKRDEFVLQATETLFREEFGKTDKLADTSAMIGVGELRDLELDEFQFSEGFDLMI